MVDVRDALFQLAWLVAAGADEAVLDVPADRFRRIDAEAERQPGALPPSPGSKPPSEGPAAPLVPDPISRANELAASCNSLEALRAALEAFEGCPLKTAAKSTVFADGIAGAKILCIGEAPGAEEDKAGKPFVGRAGQLLDRMLAAIGLSRQQNVYITNVLNWRPPGNRVPSPEEAAICLPFLRRHIELAAPELIILLGGTAVRHVSGRTDGILRLRGTWLEYFAAGKMVPMMPTLHPAYLLRQPAQKRLAWHDLQEIRARIHALGLADTNLSN
ncbi:MAG: uracil-DNA glycosylase [Alphaproteobacteria bacterium]|nr:uracil-DNA glycosylase [Alphaproteobacteria bacterium]